MASPDVVSAFTSELAANWTHCPIIPENAGGETPQDGSAFLLVQFPFVTRDQVSFGVPGANVFREEGAARMVINVERGAGLDEGRRWADELVRLFIGRDLGNCVIRAVDGPVTDDRNEVGGYFRLAVAFAYQHDFFG